MKTLLIISNKLEGVHRGTLIKRFSCSRQDIL